MNEEYDFAAIEEAEAILSGGDLVKDAGSVKVYQYKNPNCFKVNLTGKTFARLYVIGLAPTVKQKAQWLCRCECGKFPVVGARELQRGSTKSCGCLRAETSRRHMSGMDRTVDAPNRLSPLYNIWKAIRDRCNNPRNKGYKNYGGRGISVCDRWDDFTVFLSDVGERPSPASTLDRINNNGNYEPANVRWASRRQQSRNTRHNRIITVFGESKCQADWEVGSGLPVDSRRRRGWCDECAVTKPLFTTCEHRRVK